MNNDTLQAIKTYIDDVKRHYATGQATEHTYRPALANLLKALCPRLIVVNEPQRTACGAPDFVLLRSGLPVAYLEAKDVDVKDLDGKGPNREQFDRYKQALDSIAFTNYLDFHFYEHGELLDTVSIAEISGNKVKPCEDEFEKFANLVAHLADAAPMAIRRPDVLADQMAAKARLMANVVGKILADTQHPNPDLQGQFEAFKKVLIADLAPTDYADYYAQTIAYGMFTARLFDPSDQPFTRKRAAELIPKTNPFLRRIFQSIAGYDLDERLAWVVADLARLFEATDMNKVMPHASETLHNDPMIHFYEHFLAAYDPALREQAGVYYTPQPVVSFIARAIDDVLTSHFHLPKGLADNSTVERKGRTFHRVQILDPATGTGTFLAETVRRIYQRFEGNAGQWPEYVRRHLVPRINGFELLMAPYAIAHLKLGMLLRETGYNGSDNERLNIYLTNSLEEPQEPTGAIWARWLSEEAEQAGHIKDDTPVMVVMGNPPYNGASQNKSTWIMDLIKDYKKEPDSDIPLKERNPKWINDDYVKFMRMAQHYIEKNGFGIMAYINPHSYLDNPTFRGVRWQLLETYDEIYTINLHGNAKYGETQLDNINDQNVFDIQQGVSINIFIKTGTKPANSLARVFYKDLYGTRNFKYEFLNSTKLSEIDFVELHPEAPKYFFVPKDFAGKDEYMAGFDVTELFIRNAVGVVTTKDKFLVADDPAIVQKHITDLINLDEYSLRTRYNLKDTRDWTIKRAKNDVGNALDASKIIKYNYRVFDTQYLYYTGKTTGLVAWPRTEVMRELLYNNIALIVSRQCVSDWRYVFCTKTICDLNLIASAGRLGAGYVFPLFVKQVDFGEGGVREEKILPNFNPEILKRIQQGLGEEVKPIELFDYIYAVLHSPNYREQFKEFLKIDFPRIPYPADTDTYHALAQKGKQLREIHLMRGADAWDCETKFPKQGSNVVERRHFQDNRVWINQTQYFDGVPQEAWEFYIGGYQPAQNWLKYRQGRQLSYEDQEHYKHIIHALLQTRKIMAEIDEIA